MFRSLREPAAFAFAGGTLELPRRLRYDFRMPIRDVGDYYKLHTLGGAFADELLISAHGGYSARADYFTIPADWGNFELKFYAPDGYVLQDPGARRLMIGGGCPAFETLAPGARCRNYKLSKYQGRHGGGETYASLAADMTVSRSHRNMVLGLTNAERALLPAVQLNYSPTMDVLTVRNRVLTRHTPNLFEAVGLARGIHPYRVIHCSFCRVAAHHPGRDAAWSTTGGHAWS